MATRRLKAEFVGDTRDFERAMERSRAATVKLERAQADLKLQTVQVEKAQDSLTAAEKRYGAESRQAREATARLEVAQKRVAQQSLAVEKGLASTGTQARRMNREVGESTRRLTRLGDTGHKTLGQLKGAAISASTALTGGLVAGLFYSVKAAREAEVSQAKLETQVKASGASYKAHAAEIDNVIQKTANLAAVDDEDLQDAFTNILRVTGNVKQSLGLVGLAADVARAKHIDLSKAGELVGKVAGGNTGILSRYGIQIKKGATATEALGTLQKKFSGQAEAYGKTSSGAIDRAKNAVENLGESVGQALAPKIADAANATAKFVDQIRTGTGAGGKFRQALEDIYGKVKPIVKFFTDHPKLIAIAVGAWAAYKTASLVALAAIRVDAFRKVFAKSVPVAAEQGTAAGAAYSGAFDAASAGGIGKVSKGGKFATALRTFGRAAGIAGAIALGSEIALKLGEAITKKLYGDENIHTRLRQSLLAAMGVDSVLTEVGITIGNAFKDLPGAPLHPLPSNPNKVPPKAPSIRPGGRKPLGKGKSHNTATFLPKARTSRVTARASSSGVTARASSGGNYTHDQLMALWVRNGGSPARADKAAAVALAESSGNPRATSANPAGGQNLGLWQIWTGHADATTDPDGNARAAIRISNNGTDWSAWETAAKGLDTPFLTGGAPSGGGTTSPRSRLTPTQRRQRAGGAFRAAQGRARGAHGAALKGAIQAAVDATGDVENAQAFTDAVIADPTLAVGGDTHPGLAVGLAKAGEIRKIQQRLKDIQRLLKSPKLTRAQRTKLLQDVPGLKQRLSELAAPPELPTADTTEAAPTPTPGDFAESEVALSGLTKGTTDDVAALTKLKDIREAELEVAKQSGDPAKITAAAQALGSVNDALESLTPTAQDFANASIALAQLTEGTADDLAALNGLKPLLEADLEAAKQSGDPARIIAAAGALGQVLDQIKALTPTVKDFANADLALAQLTDSTADDIAALEKLKAQDQAELDAARASGDPFRILEAANALGGVIDQLKSITPKEPRTVTVEIHDAQFGNMAQVNGFAERLAFRIATAGAA